MSAECLQAQMLKGSNWLLVSIDNLSSGKSQQVGAKAKAALYFETDSTYSGAFCNSYSGKYSNPKEKILKLWAPVSTKMYCVGLDKVEKELLLLFPKTDHYRLERDELFLFTTNNFRISFKKF